MAAEESINTSDSFFMETHCVDMLGAYNRMHDYNFTIKSFNLQLLNEIPPSATIYYKLYCTCNRNDSEVRRPHNVSFSSSSSSSSCTSSASYISSLHLTIFRIKNLCYRCHRQYRRHYLDPIG